MAVAVYLHVYHVHGCASIRTANAVCQAIGTGAWHAAVEVRGQEWSYGAGAGIFCNEPCKNDKQGPLEESIPMGQTLLTDMEVRRLIALLRPEWEGKAYNLLRKNCTHFCDCLCRRLGVGGIPSRVMNLSGAGACVADVVASANAFVTDATATAQQTTSGLVTDGKLARGVSENVSYEFGDFSRGLLHRSSKNVRGILSKGKSLRGVSPESEYKFGDFSRGMIAMLSSS
mmetsp:Transcript_7942/g.13027  ORF Transcript_7942/g.13027 Transcript_7942/m.13027 type:complete len:229 (+) Transcript_7942:43-729(+)|eukprot:CAMPEP_0169130510 /NCGR_PEP_ID=MMETSP1015-20121227/37740_1 /TAXON_ID=342587 /ORGANISM="Karlodinium micrum, Strain CCMP2283" /LENGTH=228 /DNA_ID=CAMNT_0009194685 /DNA_START=43 /DNA_END=729 /DNA_ORIENTATION=+